MKKTLVLAVALLAFAAVLWNIGERPSSAINARNTGEAAATARARMAARSQASRASPATARYEEPLPPVDTPASVSYAELKESADAGSPRAACRLAFELLRCQALMEGPGVRRSFEKREAEAEKAGMSEAANMLAAQELEATSREADCRKLPSMAVRDASNYLYQAASAGNATAQVRYISGQMFGSVADSGQPLSGLGFLHHPEYERWRRNAPEMAKQMLISHPAVNIALMGMAYGSDERPFEALIPDDPVQQWVYVEASRRIVGLPARSPEQFDPESRARIASLERELAGRIPDDAQVEHSLLDAMSAPGSALGEWSDSGCDTPARTTKR